MTFTIENIIALPIIDGKYHAKAEVVDCLLDMRNLASKAANSALVARIDTALSDVPGKSLTDLEWVTAQAEECEAIWAASDMSTPSDPVGEGVPSGV